MFKRKNKVTLSSPRDLTVMRGGNELQQSDAPNARVPRRYTVPSIVLTNKLNFSVLRFRFIKPEMEYYRAF